MRAKRACLHSGLDLTIRQQQAESSASTSTLDALEGVAKVSPSVDGSHPFRWLCVRRDLTISCMLNTLKKHLLLAAYGRRAQELGGRNCAKGGTSQLPATLEVPPLHEPFVGLPRRACRALAHRGFVEVGRGGVEAGVM